MDSGIRVFYENVEGLTYEKWMELRVTMMDYGIDIVVLTNIMSQVASIEQLLSFTIPGYRLLTNDLTTVQHGVCIYVSEQLRCRQITQGVLASYDEGLWIIIDGEILMGAVYRDVTSPTLIADDEKLITAISESVQLVDKVPIVMGDFGMQDAMRNELHQKITQVNYRQRMAYERARALQGTWLFTNSDDVRRISTGFPLMDGTHCSVTFHLKHEPFRSKLIKQFACYDHADYAKMKEKLEIDWEQEFKNISATQAVIKLESRIKEAVRTCVPQEESRPDILPSWMHKRIKRVRRLLKEKHYMWEPHGDRSEKYLAQIQMVQETISKGRLSYEKQLKLSDVSEWISEYLPDEKHEFEKIDYITDKSQENITGDYQMAQAFMKYFQSVYRPEKPIDGLNENVECKFSLPELIITEEMVFEELGQLKLTTAGPDRINPAVLHHLASTLAPALAIIFNRSITDNNIPNNWKKARIIPKYKSGDKSRITNYRPISITSAVCKILERLIMHCITNHLFDNDMFSPFQHGYKGGRSRHTNLIECLDAWTTAVEAGLSVDVLYLDLSKAFDTVPHQRLLLQLLHYGVNRQLVFWMANFLIGRTSYVRFNQQESDTKENISGVPQGSVLANLLFTIFMNKVPSKVKCSIQMYCDDIKLYSVLHTSADGTVSSSLQEDLTSLDVHTKENLMNFNAAKCKVLHVGVNNPRLSYEMEVEGAASKLEEVNVQRDLGIHVDEDLTFAAHIDIVIEKAMTRLKCMEHNFAILHEQPFLACYYTIRNMLESASSVWSPIDPNLVDKLEAVQRHATSLVNDLKELSYSQRLQKLKLPTLQHRRHRGDLIQMYRLVHGFSKMHTPIPTISPHVPPQHSKSIRIETPTTSHRKSFMYNRVAHAWNSLCEETISAETIESFTELLDKDLQSDAIYNYQFQTDQ